MDVFFLSLGGFGHHRQQAVTKGGTEEYREFAR